MLVIGAHMSVAKGLDKTAERVVEMGANTMQIFSRNPRGSSFKTYGKDEVEAFQQIRKEAGFGPILAHAPYTLNLASGNQSTYEFACMVLKEDVARMEKLGVEYLVFHPGSHTGIGTDAGIRNIIAGINQAMTGNEKLMILLETMSGKGTEIGVTFEELKEIRENVRCPERVGICMDTCHVFAAGYDIVGHLEEMLDEFHQVLGLEQLKAIHLNDSIMPFASKKDRHATIGNGEIGKEALLNFVRNPRLFGVPIYLETPLEDEGHKEEIQMIKENLYGVYDTALF